MSHFVKPALSATQKYIAAPVGEFIAIIDAATGKTVGRVNTERELGHGILSFRPDGKQIAFIGGETLRVWDVQKGASVGQSFIPNTMGWSIDWPSDGLVLVDATYLVDLTKKMVLWKYDRSRHGNDRDTASFGGRLWYLVKNDRSGKNILASAALPDEQAKRAAARLDVNEVFAVKSGMSVSVELNGIPADSTEKVRQSLTDKLKANGLTIGDAQPIKLVATMESGKSREVDYGHGVGPWREGQKVTVTEQVSRVAFIDNQGKTLWQRESRTFPPPLVMRNQGQSIEQAVAEATKPNMAMFLNVEIPEFVPKEQYKAGLGTSQLTAQGIAAGKSAKQ